MKRALIISIGLALLAGRCLAAPAAAPNKFLFVVDASAAMASRAELAALAVADLIERGLSGRMQRGDLFTILPFHEQPDPVGYARQVWDPDRSRHISNLAFLYLQKYDFQKKPRMDRAMALVLQAIQREENLAVYLISSGEEPVLGTPFDADINAVYRQNMARWRAIKGIAVTALVAEQGKLADWAVGVAEPPAPVQLIARKKVIEPPKVAADTNQQSIAVKPPEVKPTPPKETKPIVPDTVTKPPDTKPPVEIKPIEIKPQITEVKPKPNDVKPAEIKPPVEDVKPTPSVTNITSAPVNPPETKPPTPGISEPPKPVDPPKPLTNPIIPPPTNIVTKPPTESVVGPTTTVTAAVAPAATNRPALPVQQLATGGANRLSNSPAMLLASLGFLVLAAWLGVMWYRRTRPAPAPSLITQSMERDRQGRRD